MIRTHTFIKYARLNLQEAEAALQEEDYKKVGIRCKDMAAALLKALAAFVPSVSIDMENLDEKSVKRLVSDLASSKQEADSATNKMVSLLRGTKEPGSRIEAESIYSTAGELFQVIHDLCAA